MSERLKIERAACFDTPAMDTLVARAIESKFRKSTRPAFFKFEVGQEVFALIYLDEKLQRLAGTIIARFDADEFGGCFVVDLEQEFTTQVHSMPINRVVYHAFVLRERNEP